MPIFDGTSSGNEENRELTPAQYEHMIEDLQLQVRELRKKSKFGLVWEDKPDAQVQKVSESIPLIREDVSKRVKSADGDTDHILINGDNYHALLVLQSTHLNKVDVIYIDPPYNTGNKDFIYNDAYLDQDDVYWHSKWLSFMEKRLKLAHNLLTDDGVIFVSIDDNEQARLRLLMDEVFGSKNFMSTMIWDKSNTKNDAKNFQRNHEYIHVYGKTSKAVVSRYSMEERRVVKDDRGYYIREGLTMGGGVGGTLNGRPNLGYTFYYNPVTDEFLPVQDQNIELAKTSNDENVVYTTRQDLVDAGFVPIRPKKNGQKLGCWKWGQIKADSDSHKIFFTLTNTGYYPAYKRYMDSSLVVEKNGVHLLRSMVKRNVRSMMHHTNGEGTRTLKYIFGSKPFNNPKSVSMIKDLVGFVDKKNAIVLDFFAGSGTTAHAVAELNYEDGGKRQCILVTDAGKLETAGESSKHVNHDSVNIAEEITYERVKMALTGLGWAFSKKAVALGGNLRYFDVELMDVGEKLEKSHKNKIIEGYEQEFLKLAELSDAEGDHDMLIFDVFDNYEKAQASLKN